MSDSFEMLVDVDVKVEKAEELSRSVLDHFRRLGLITGDASSDCVLGGTGYRPGPVIPSSYKCEAHECRFWELITCGVEPEVGRGLNGWALGSVSEGFFCCACGRQPERPRDAFVRAIWDAVDQWKEESGPALLQCPLCGEKSSITQWRSQPPLGFGNLSFRFWNWPPLDSPSWTIDIPALVREITGHRIESTWGRI